MFNLEVMKRVKTYEGMARCYSIAQGTPGHARPHVICNRFSAEIVAVQSDVTHVLPFRASS